MYKHFINGRFVEDADAASRIEVFNPATEERIADIPHASAATVDEVAAARKAQPAWAALPPIERAGYVKAIAANIRDNAESLTEIVFREQGKIRDLALGEVLGIRQ
ncbi:MULTISPECIES: aldehyde dehydrogenase family protein [unclassified Mesorhizobium]|uniref:aldehyde dehydrogenase family protein n=1 Tax=unclassified Mesorhizobium TaxID=325217 RepID=UPI00333B8FCF